MSIRALALAFALATAVGLGVGHAAVDVVADVGAGRGQARPLLVEDEPDVRGVALVHDELLDGVLEAGLAVVVERLPGHRPVAGRQARGALGEQDLAIAALHPHHLGVLAGPVAPDQDLRDVVRAAVAAVREVPRQVDLGALLAASIARARHPTCAQDRCHARKKEDATPHGRELITLA